MIDRLIQAHCASRSLCVFLIVALTCAFAQTNASAQVPTHPDAKSPLPANPYMKHNNAWRWDIRAQVLMRGGVNTYYEPGQPRTGESERTKTITWPMLDLEVVFPVIRSGGFYWSPNKEVEVSIRAGDFERTPKREQMYTKDSGAEYTRWESDIKAEINQIHLIHESHIVVADTVFNERKARNLAWPDLWKEGADRYLTPVVDSVGKEPAADAAETVKTLLDFWVDNKDPKAIPELDLVKFLTGKVIEHVKVSTPPAEFSNRGGNRLSAVAFVGGTTWSGFVVRSAEVIAREPSGSKHDLATLLTAVLRSAGVPARTVACVNDKEDDVLQKLVSLVEFAMYDPDLDLTFWVPIDVDKLRLNGRRSSQYKQAWNYFGTHDELHDYIPIAYYFHPPASYRAFDLPAFYGVQSSSPLPEYVIQSILIDPMVSPVTGP